MCADGAVAVRLDRDLVDTATIGLSAVRSAADDDASEAGLTGSSSAVAVGVLEDDTGQRTGNFGLCDCETW